MNYKDKEAYAIYESTIFEREGYLYIAREAWQAACEYKQKEIDELNKAVEFFASENTHYFESLEKLQAENAKLIECVKFYADKEGQAWAACQGTDTKDTCCHMVAESSGGKRARQVLKELKDK